MAKIRRLENRAVNSLILSKRDASLIFEAGTALAGISTYLNPSPSTQPADMVTNARDAISNVYSQKIIDAYLRTLRNSQLTNEAEELQSTYAQLRKLARLD